MNSKNKRILHRFVVGILNASMVAPAVMPAFPVFAAESVRDTMTTITATNSEADEDFLIEDGEILAGDVATASTATEEVTVQDIDVLKTNIASSSYPVFGTTAFWDWFNDLIETTFADADDDEAYEAAMETLEQEITAWHLTVMEDETATDSDADKDYPPFDDSYDEENSPFWKWFFEDAITVDSDGNLIGYKNSVILDWIAHSSTEDVIQFMLNFYSMRQATPLSAIGSLWPDGYGTDGDLYSHGNGTEESPYIIDSVADLRTLAITIASDNKNEDTYYLIKNGTYDLNGSWIPIGFPRNDGGDAVAFKGHIAAEDGANIKNIGFKANSALGISSTLAETIRAQKSVGFFGELGAGATVTNLYLNTSGNTMEGTDYAGILAGSAVDATIKECTVAGIVKGKGYVGGIVGYAKSSTSQAHDRNMVIEDCSADKAAVYSTKAVQYANEFCNGHSCIGGIVGYAANTTIMDVYVSTNTGDANHIYGNGAYVGGVVGVMENSDVFNSYVYDGEIGENNAYAVGGIVGGYNGGQVKVGRFSATVLRPTSTNNYSACFIGTRVNGAGFTYGEDGDIAYLFSDTKTKADTGICGARIEDDGIYDTSAHIGYWHASDNYYTLLSGSNVDNSEDYFYAELENGILNIKRTAANAETINHFTADKQGRPTRGYLLTINDPMVDGTKAASISAYISGSYKPVVTSENLGAFAPGDVVYISFQDLADGTGYFQMDDTKTQNPWYSYYEEDTFNVFEDGETTKGITKGAGYYITMPESDVTLGAIYKKVSQSVTVNPQKIVFEVTQIRTGSRENPNIEWQVTAYNGNKDVNSSAAVITDANGNVWENKTIMTVDANGRVTKNEDALFWLNSLVNGSNNDKFNLSWSTSNDGNHAVLSNPTVENGLTNGKEAYFTFDFENSAIADKVAELAQTQANAGYKDSLTTSQPYWYHSIITATAQVEDSEDKTNPPKGYADIDIKLNIKDNTNVSVNGVALSKNNITYDVVRTLSGSRANPKVSYTVNGEAPDSSDETVANLSAAFNPDYFTGDQVSWYLSEVKDGASFEDDKNTAVLADKGTQDDGTINVALTGSGDKAYYNANVTLKGITSDSCDNSTISTIVKAQDTAYTSQLKAVPDTTSTYTKYVKVTAEDQNNNAVTDTCKVTVNFKTVDQTEIMPEELQMTGGISVTGSTINNVNNMHGYNIVYTFANNSKSDIIARNIYVKDASNTAVTNGEGETFTAKILPEKDNTQSEYQPYDKTVVWSLANADITGQPNFNPYDVLNIDSETGKITVRGYNDSNDPSDNGYSPWVQDQISKGNLNGVTVKINVIATSARDNSLVQSKTIEVTFTAGSMSTDIEDGMNFDVVLTKNVATSLADTDVNESESWSGIDAQSVTATATGTSESPSFSIYDPTGTNLNGNVVSISGVQSSDGTSTGNVNVKTDAAWIKNIINNRKSNNSGQEVVLIKAKTTNGTSVTEVPIIVNFRYDGVDMSASVLGELPDGYEASPDVITSDTADNTYDVNKASVKDRLITMNVVATQGNYSVNNPGTRKWSYGIVKLDNTTYSSQGVQENDAVYELSGDIKNYCKVENGYLVPIKGLWEDLISAGETSGSVSGIVTAKKEIDGKSTSDSYKVTINFRYDKAVLDSHEETFDVVYTQDSQTNSVKSHWSGDNFIQLTAHISDESGKDVTPVWESSDESIVTVDQDGRVYVNKDTWMQDIIDAAQNYGEDVHSGTKTVTVTAKHPATGATADTCQFTVNFRYDQAILDTHETTYNLILTQTSRTNNPSAVWSGNDIRKLNSKVFVEPGLNNNPYWASEDSGIVTVDEAGNIEAVVNAEWQMAIVNANKFVGQKKIAINATNNTQSIKDSCNVTVNFQYEDVEMEENAKTMDVVLTASGLRSNPTYKITGTKSAVAAVINSVDPEEKDIVYSSSDSGLVAVNADGTVTFTLPSTISVNEDGTLVSNVQNKSVSTLLNEGASSFVKEAMKHSYNDTTKYISKTTAVITAASKDNRMADQCNMTINLKYVDNTYTRSGGGGGGGSSSGGGGGSSSSGSSPSGSRITTTSNLPSYVLKGGNWTQNALGQWFYSNGRTFTDEWAAVQNPYADVKLGQPAYDWFHFGTDSVMTTGWYTDNNGDTYYTHTVSDGTLGHMYTGWQWIDDNGDGIAECYYFETESNGYRGRLYKSTTTPDGYSVNERGQWVQNGIVITKDTTVNQTPQVELPTYVLESGDWASNAAGQWTFSKDGRQYANEWAALYNPYADVKLGQPAYDWFHFGTNGIMTTGWYTDSDGNTYYLHPISDGTQGHMYTGWQWIDDNGDGIAECYYFETESNGSKGRLYKSTKTPDGYSVNEKGQRLENGSVVTKKLS